MLDMASLYTHQKVVLELDFAGSLWGYTELTVVPESKDLRAIHLNSRQCTIHSVTVASQPAEFVHNDPLTTLHTSKPQDGHTHPELKRQLYSALAEGDEGELSIGIPKDVVIKQSGHALSGIVSEAATPEPQTPGFTSQPSMAAFEFAPIVVKVVYSLRNPADGVQFVLPSDAYPYRVPHVYTTASSPDSARCWVPCLDNLWVKCTWEFQFVVPRHLEQMDEDLGLDDDEPQESDYPTVVICSGELMEQISHPHNSGKTIFLFFQATLTSAQHIAWAAGPFHVHTIPSEMTTAEDASGILQPSMHAFCLPGQEQQLTSSVSSMRSAMSFFSSEFGSYPFGSYKLVFVDEMPTQRFDAASLSIVTVDLLHGEDAIDQVYETRLCLSHALACQWIGINIQQKTWSDTWLVNGLGLYITGLYLRKLLGTNEYRFRLKKDMERIVDMDSGPMFPICQPQVLEPPDTTQLAFINLKAPLILHILDRRLGKSGTSLGLSRVLPKVFLSAISGEMQNNTISTHAFLRMCRKVSGIDPRSFAEQWIYGSGCPTFGFSASFNRKKMAVEIQMRQDSPAYKAHENNDVEKILYKPVQFFEGQMTIRIHEADGTPYEHVLDIRSPFKRYEVPFNTKYKRVRRNTKRYLARQAAAQAAAEGDAEAAAAMDMIDMGFGLEIWEKEKERENWKVADWTEEDEQNMSGQTYEWIRIDADFEWISAISFDQKDYMWVSQLQRDRDVVAQYEAITILARQPNAILSSTFTKTVLVSNYYFRIRCEAAQALVTCAVQRLDWIGLFHLFKLFLRYCYEPEDPNQDLFTHTYVPRPNEFNDFAEYFVRKSLLQAISRVRFENGKTPTVVRQFLIDQLRYNDNTSNPYSDALYICTIIAALACATVSTVPPERGEFVTADSRPPMDPADVELLKQAVAEVDRYRSMDRLIPSIHNVVSIATVEFHLLLSVANLISCDNRMLIPLTREGNYTQVRMAAFDALFLTKWYTPNIMQYVLSVMAHDTSRTIRRYVARNACQSLALLVNMGEMEVVKKSKSVLVEEDGASAEGKKDNQQKSDLDLMLKALRKDPDVGKNPTLRNLLMPLALSPDVDREVRWCLLKLADLVFRGDQEQPPKVVIHLPPTPVIEAPPPLPITIKPPLKPQRTLSIKEGTPIKSPLTPAVGSTKLKLSGAGTRIDVTARFPDISTPRTDLKRASNGGFAVPKPPVPKKAVTKAVAKHVPKAQSGGMTTHDVVGCRATLKKLIAHKSAPLFRQPVDPVRDRAPDYLQVIKNPMDLSTMGVKLDRGLYKDRSAFEQDFRLMVTNAKLYNAPKSYPFEEASKLETYFEREWTRMNKTLEAKAPPRKPEAPPPLTPTVKIHPSTRVPPTPATPTPASSASSRPVIKLKVGGPKLNGSVPSPVSIPAPVSESFKFPKKPKDKKLKPTPLATSTTVESYFDDQSADADLLEEVLAIEREQKEGKQRDSLEKDRTREKDRERPREKERDLEERELERRRDREKDKDKQTIPKVIIGKRKKPALVEANDEDEILALATPAKKEKSAAPSPVPIAGPSTASAKSSEKGSARPSPAPVPVATPQPKNGVTKSEKGLKERDPILKPSLKGKEREVPSPVPTPKSKKPSPVRAAITPINERKCKDIVRTLQKNPDAAIFLQPVDPVRDGCPTYYDEIKVPMDFGTIQAKLNSGEYRTMEEFAKDVELIFANCRQFNPPTTYPVNCADAVEKVWIPLWSKTMQKKLQPSEKKSLQSLMNKLVADPISFIFREPVDPVLLQIPTYFDVIPKKNARDLRTIRQKLDTEKYDSIDAWEADMDLMIDNAVLFNGAESEVGVIATQLRNKYKDMIANARGGSTSKRKGGEKGTPQPTKKARLG